MDDFECVNGCADYETQIVRLADLKLLSIIDGLDCLQPVLSSDPPRRSNNREPLKEALVADLGDQWVSSPYLIVRELSLLWFAGFHTLILT